MAKDYVNAKTSKNVYYSRYIASWLNVGGFARYRFGNMFELWLYRLGLSSEEISDVLFMATSGKFELERNAEEFLSSDRASMVMVPTYNPMSRRSRYTPDEEMDEDV